MSAGNRVAVARSKRLERRLGDVGLVDGIDSGGGTRFRRELREMGVVRPVTVAKRDPP